MNLFERMKLTILLWSPFSIVLLSIPSSIFISNPREFLTGYAVMYPLFSVSLFVLLLADIAIYLSSRIRSIAPAFGLLAVFLQLAASLVPGNWSPLDGADRFKDRAIDSVYQVALLACVSLIFWLIPRKHRGTSILAFVIPVVLSALFGLIFGATDREFPLLKPAPIHNSEVRGLDRPNIYQIVFDGLSGRYFKSTSDGDDRTSTYSDMIWYSGAKANFIQTDYSVPSFMTGIEPLRAVKPWQALAKIGGIRSFLQNNGYTVWDYVPDPLRPWSFNGANFRNTSLEESGLLPDAVDEATLLQIILVKISPAPIRGYIYTWAKRVFPQGYDTYKTLGPELVSKMIDDEGKRPDANQYVYLHVMIPHPPYVHGNRCELSAGATYDTQAHCAFREIALIINRLRDVGHFQHSIVIVQSDHGYHTPDKNDGYQLPPVSDERILTYLNRATAGIGGWDGYQRRTNALLLVHFPNESNSSLRVESRPVQLLDIPSSISTAAGLKSGKFGGYPLQFSPIGGEEPILLHIVEQHSHSGEPEIKRIVFDVKAQSLKLGD